MAIPSVILIVLSFSALCLAELTTKYYKEPATWFTAKSTCQGDGGWLLMPTDNEDMKKAIAKIPEKTDIDSFWLASYKTNTSWKWQSDGQSVNVYSGCYQLEPFPRTPAANTAECATFCNSKSEGFAYKGRDCICVDVGNNVRICSTNTTDYDQCPCEEDELDVYTYSTSGTTWTINKFACYKSRSLNLNSEETCSLECRLYPAFAMSGNECLCLTNLTVQNHVTSAKDDVCELPCSGSPWTYCGGLHNGHTKDSYNLYTRLAERSVVWGERQPSAGEQCAYVSTNLVGYDRWSSARCGAKKRYLCSWSNGTKLAHYASTVEEEEDWETARKKCEEKTYNNNTLMLDERKYSWRASGNDVINITDVWVGLRRIPTWVRDDDLSRIDMTVDDAGDVDSNCLGFSRKPGELHASAYSCQDLKPFICGGIKVKGGQTDGDDAGKKAGIAVGVIATVAILAIVGFLLIRRHRKRKADKDGLMRSESTTYADISNTPVYGRQNGGSSVMKPMNNPSYEQSMGLSRPLPAAPSSSSPQRTNTLEYGEYELDEPQYQDIDNKAHNYESPDDVKQEKSYPSLDGEYSVATLTVPDIDMTSSREYEVERSDPKTLNCDNASVAGGNVKIGNSDKQKYVSDLQPESPPRTRSGNVRVDDPEYDHLGQPRQNQSELIESDTYSHVSGN